MGDKRRKADYVRDESKTHDGKDKHHCHWPGCTKIVPPAMWGCKKHWYMLPGELRKRLWNAFRPGQEITKDPSKTYLNVANEIQVWIHDNFLNRDTNDDGDS